MKIVNKKKFLQEIDFYIKEMKKGKIFIFPTDTIYGIGCIATNKNSIEKIKIAKKRKNKPFALIVPNKKWIFENLKVNQVIKYEIEDKLPGKYTFILEIQNNKIDLFKINDLSSLGVRILSYWFQNVIEKLDFPFIATSVNLSGEKNCTCLNDVNLKIVKYVDYFINDGVLNNKASTIIDLRNNNKEIIRK